MIGALFKVSNKPLNLLVPVAGVEPATKSYSQSFLTFFRPFCIEQSPDNRQRKPRAGANTCVRVTKIMSAEPLKSRRLRHGGPNPFEIGARLTCFLARNDKGGAFGAR